MSEERKPIGKVLMVFARDCECTDGTTGQIWYVIDADGNIPSDPSDYRIYGGKAVKRPFPGSIYEFDDYGETSIGQAVYKGLWENEDDRRKWTTLHRGYHDQKRLDAQEARDRKDDAFSPLLEKLRKEYNRLVGPNRHLFLARIISKITGG